jgi:hypothetical protein
MAPLKNSEMTTEALIEKEVSSCIVPDTSTLVVIYCRNEEILVEVECSIGRCDRGLLL